MSSGSSSSSTNKFLASIVQWLDKHNISFRPTATSTSKLHSIRKKRNGHLHLLFQDGVRLVVKGVTIARDLIDTPFELLTRTLNGLIPNPEPTAQPNRPIIITLFSFLSIFSLFGLFSLVRLL